MFCNNCGAQLQPEFNLCSKCGNSARQAPVTANAPAYRTRLERHLRPISILWIIVGVLWLIPSGALMLFSHFPRLMMHDEMFTHAFMPHVLFSLGSVFLLVAAGGILVGWGLMNHERWARCFIHHSSPRWVSIPSGSYSPPHPQQNTNASPKRDSCRSSARTRCHSGKILLGNGFWMGRHLSLSSRKHVPRGSWQGECS